MKRLKVLLVGVGTVGEAIANVARGRPWLERMVLADYNVDSRARGPGATAAGDAAGDRRAFPVARRRRVGDPAPSSASRASTASTSS